MQDIQLFKEFIQFCDSQPKDKHTDHTSWQQCAVGQFFGWVSFHDVDISLIESLLGEELYKKVEHSPSMQITCPNYGDFTTFLKLELDKLEVMVDNEGN